MNHHDKRLLVMTEGEKANTLSLFLRLFLGGFFTIVGIVVLIFQIPFFEVEIFNNTFPVLLFGIILFSLGISLVGFEEKRYLHFSWISLGLLSLTFFLFIWNKSLWYFIPFSVSVIFGFISLANASHYEEHKIE